METVYVTVMSYGSYDEHIVMIIYAGLNYETAKQKAIDFVFPDPSQNWGYVEHWVDGKKIKDEEVRS